jgi:DNA-binding NtrC family response regulator
MPKKILIIDDDKEFCEELAEILKDESYSVRMANDGLQGERLLREEPFDLVLLDFKMPGLNGVEMIKKIKEMNAKTRAFLISGRPFIDKVLEEEKISRLIEGFMSKPLDIEKFLRDIRDIL